MTPSDCLQNMVCYFNDTGYFLGDRYVLAKFLQCMPDELIHPNMLALATPADVTVCAVPTPEILWAVLRQMRHHYGTGEPGDQTVHFAMPCGLITRFIAFDDLPWHDTPCPCGNPGHYLIRYSRSL